MFFALLLGILTPIVGATNVGAYHCVSYHIPQIEEVGDTVVVRDTICEGENYQQNGFFLKNLSMGVYFDTLQASGDLICLELYVFPNPQLSLTYEYDTLVCKGVSVDLCATATAKWNRYAVHVGEVLCSDSTILSVDDFIKSSKTAVGVVYYVDRSGFHGSAIALKDAQQKTLWCSLATTPEDWACADLNHCITDLNGAKNTNRMLTSGSVDMFPVLNNIEVVYGWYLPAYGQMRLMYAYFSEVMKTLKLLAENGSEVDLFSGIYWTSTQSSNKEACTFEYRGLLKSYSFDNERKTRAVIDF